MATKNVFEKLSTNFPDPPLVSGPRVFLTTEYASVMGLKRRSMHDRLQTLLADNKIRRVRTKRNGRVVPAWEYLGK